MSSSSSDLTARVDAAIAALASATAPEDTAQLLAVLANRTAARLHAVARTESTARKEQPDWAIWAQLQNASRSLVLQASTCRDLAMRLTRHSA
ncbi:MAG: hypothetical protein NVSMB2_10550 [Chloroflexota bacterium]